MDQKHNEIAIRTFQAQVHALEDEKTYRVYYQNIVYDLCNKVDVTRGGSVLRGTGVVCGNPSRPSTELQDAVEELFLELRGIRGTLREKDGLL